MSRAPASDAGAARRDAITARTLGKRYGEVVAVDALDLNVRRGEIYALLGRNGAGKTTTIRMLLGLVRPTHGEVAIFGHPVGPGGTDSLRRVGSLVETASAYPNLTVRENLELHGGLMGAPQSAIADAIGQLALTAYADRRADRLSLGNLQRLALARALLHAPDLVILDEPANGLDPAGIVEIRTLLRSLSVERGVTVFLSSHILSEVAQLADRIGIMHEGRLLEELDRAGLRTRERPYVDVIASDLARARALMTQAGFEQVEQRDDTLRAYDATGREAELARLLVGAGLDLSALAPGHEDLESYFLRRTGDAG